MPSVTASPGTLASDNSNGGATAWTNPSNAAASDNSYAVATNHSSSHYLKATNFGFSIPSGATITGVLLEIECKSNGGSVGTVKIVKGGSVVGNGGTSPLFGPINMSAVDTYNAYGGVNSLQAWNVTLTDTDVNASNFGCVFSVGNGGKGSYTTSVDHIRITVYYETGTATGGSVGPSLGGTAVNTGGTVAWVNPGNAVAEDGSFATFTRSNTGPSDTLVVTNFGFAVPAGAVIKGVLVEIKKKGSAATNFYDFSIHLEGPAATLTRADTVTAWSTTLAYVSCGSSIDLWGTSDLTPTLVNASTFGVRLRANRTAGSGSQTASVDSVRITVYYDTYAAAGIDADAGQGLLDLTAVAPTVTKGASLPAVGLDLTAIAATTSKSTTLTAVAVELVGLAGDTPLLAAAGQGLIEVLPVVAATAKQAASGQGLIDVTPLAAATTKAVASGQGSIDFTPVAANATKQAASGQGLVDLTLVAATAAKSAASGQGLVDLTPVAPAAAHAAAVPTDAWLLAPVAPASTKGVASGQGLIDWSPVPAIVTYAAALPADAWLLLPVSPETSKSAVLAAVGVELVGVIAEVELIGIAKFSFQATLVRAPTWASLRRAGT
jgi:hypothetical protein